MMPATVLAEILFSPNWIDSQANQLFFPTCGLPTNEFPQKLKVNRMVVADDGPLSQAAKLRHPDSRCLGQGLARHNAPRKLSELGQYLGSHKSTANLLIHLRNLAVKLVSVFGHHRKAY
jgi:hypothetical protein